MSYDLESGRGPVCPSCNVPAMSQGDCCTCLKCGSVFRENPKVKDTDPILVCVCGENVQLTNYGVNFTQWQGTCKCGMPWHVEEIDEAALEDDEDEEMSEEAMMEAAADRHEAMMDAYNPRQPYILEKLASEARKAGSWDDFRKDFTHDIKHGVYWHWTDDPNFTIDPKKGPRDMSTMASGTVDVGALMVTSDLMAWSKYGNRPYVALIDMSDVPREAYYQVYRGFGNEFYVMDPSRARVVKVMTRKQAMDFNRRQHAHLPESENALEEFYHTVVESAPDATSNPCESQWRGKNPSKYRRYKQRPVSHFVEESPGKKRMRTVPVKHSDAPKRFKKIRGAKAVVGKLKPRYKIPGPRGGRSWTTQTVLVPKK